MNSNKQQETSNLGGLLGGGLAFAEISAAGESTLVKPRIRVDGDDTPFKFLNVNRIHY